jgi:hypothetical protein
MQTSLSFLATDINQLPTLGQYGNEGVEAVSFNRSDLEKDNWDLVWRNIETASKLYLPHNVTYHFPMNDSDFVEDKYVFAKLKEAVIRSADVGLKGLVVHSNRIKTFHEWQKLNLDEERLRVLSKLDEVVMSNTSPAWIGLENMPLVGNSGYDVDPLFCFSGDFGNLPDNLSVTWDVCHYLSTLAYIKAADQHKLTENLVLRQQQAGKFDFGAIADRIRHWHFAAFKGLNDPAKGTVCVEGVLPHEGDLDPSIYREMLSYIRHHSAQDSTINFEVQENDYINRQGGPALVEWSKAILSA